MSVISTKLAFGDVQFDVHTLETVLCEFWPIHSLKDKKKYVLCLPHSGELP